VQAALRLRVSRYTQLLGRILGLSLLALLQFVLLQLVVADVVMMATPVMVAVAVAVAAAWRLPTVVR
jgi:hypothetical protein